MNKFDKLYNKIISECKNTKVRKTKKVIKESTSDLPMNVKDAIAQWMWDYLCEEKDAIRWPEDENWGDYDGLMETSEIWDNDEDIQNHFSDPGSHFKDFEEVAEYDPATNTLTLTVSKTEDVFSGVAYEDEEELQEAIDELNEDYAEINGIKFIWR